MLRLEAPMAIMMPMTAGAPSTEESERALGQHIRGHRIAARLTQVELAERANVSLGTVKNLEQGVGSTISTLVKVLRALGRDDWLHTLAVPPKPFNPLDLREARAKLAARGPSRVRSRGPQ